LEKDTSFELVRVLCRGQMRILAFIEDEEVIEKILKHLGLWDLKVRPPPKVKASSLTISIDITSFSLSLDSWNRT
jgi:hypothetical protein